MWSCADKSRLDHELSGCLTVRVIDRGSTTTGNNEHGYS